MLSTGSISRAPTSLLSHNELAHKHTRADDRAASLRIQVYFRALLQLSISANPQRALSLIMDQAVAPAAGAAPRHALAAVRMT